MTQYRFHWSPNANNPVPIVTLEAESHLHGAALALREFMQQGCDVAAPLAHVDVTEVDGAKQTLLVEEVLEWLQEPQQANFIDRQGLAVLLSRT